MNRNGNQNIANTPKFDINKNVKVQLTDAERRLIDGLTDGKRGKEFGKLQVRNYLGHNSALRALNGTAKSIGYCYGITEVGATGVREVWYFEAINGDKIRIPEPKNGIDTVLDIEFKRNDV